LAKAVTSSLQFPKNRPFDIHAAFAIPHWGFIFMTTERIYTILMIEDNRDQAHLMNALLAKHEKRFKVDVVHDPIAGLESLAQNNYEAVILDYNLPHMNGLDTLQKIKKNNYPVSVIMVTGQGDERIAVQAIRIGAQDYLTKSPHYLNLLPDILVRAIEEKQLSIRLEQSKKSFYSLFENASIAIFIADARTGQILQINKMAEDLLGFSQGELVSKTILQICSQKYHQSLNKLLHEIRIKENTNIDNIGFIHKDSSIVPIDLSGSLVQLGTNKVIQFFARDIREKIKMQRQLLLSRQRLVSLFDGITDPISVQDSDHNIIMGNKKYIQLAKKNVKQVVNEKCYLSFFNESEPCEGCPAKETFESGESKFIEIFHNGRTFHLWTFPMEDLQGKPQFLVEYVKDVTEQKDVEKQLIKSEKLATLGILSSGIAHELRNPLSIIETARYSIADSLNGKSPGIDDKLDVIRRNIVRASSIIDNLLQFSRHSKYEKEKVNAEQLLDDTISLFQKEISTRNIHIEPIYHKIPRIFFSVDSLKQVFLNLIMNSIQAMPEGGVLKISTSLSPDRNWASIKFLDSGIGISKENLKYIFTPFFTTKGDSGGTGLGLYLSYSIIKKEGGDIAVQSDQNIGTTFSIKLPIAKTSDNPY
jgi:PAS domain S-box-containing protein